VFGAMVALHAAVIGGAALEVVVLHRPFIAALGLPALVLVVLANALRLWVIRTLGVHWNVRVVRSMPLGVVTGGPYRFVRHPNYVAVFSELLALPLVHGAYLTAVFGSLLHVLVLRRRVTLEESVLMADESYRRAFAGKPRFLPWPTRP
jgi:methyltransferase